MEYYIILIRKKITFNIKYITLFTYNKFIYIKDKVNTCASAQIRIQLVLQVRQKHVTCTCTNQKTERMFGCRVVSWAKGRLTT